LRSALGNYLEHEGEAVDEYAGQIPLHVPFRERRGGGEDAS
jgi:predicted N-acyltransferase